MALRREATSPTSVEDALTRRIDALERKINRMNKPGRKTLQTVDASLHFDPVEGEVILNHPGDHVNAEGTEGLMYFHDGEWKGIAGQAKTHYGEQQPFAGNISDDWPPGNYKPIRIFSNIRSASAIADGTVTFQNNSAGVLTTAGTVAQSFILEDGLWYVELTADHQGQRTNGFVEPMYFGVGLAIPGFAGSQPQHIWEVHSKHLEDNDGINFTACGILRVPSDGNEFMAVYHHTIVGDDLIVGGCEIEFIKLGEYVPPPS